MQIELCFVVHEIIVVRQTQFHRGLSKEQAAYLLMEERTCQVKWENFTQCN